MAIRVITETEIVEKIMEAIAFISFNPDNCIQSSFKKAYEEEVNPVAKDVLHAMILNIDIAKEQSIPLCQDTGSLVVFAEIGNELIIEGNPLQQIINTALARATEQYYLRPSTVQDPLANRANDLSNCPAILHTRIVTGTQLRLVMGQKGGGAENMSRLKMFNPTAEAAEISDFVVETVKLAGAKACPPLVIGIGIGGNFETCAVLAKEALFKPLSEHHSNPFYVLLEKDILTRVNATNIGAQGMGGNMTALSLRLNTAPCHIASLPVAVNLQCHAHRHIEITL